MSPGTRTIPTGKVRWRGSRHGRSAEGRARRSPRDGGRNLTNARHTRAGQSEGVRPGAAQRLALSRRRPDIRQMRHEENIWRRVPAECSPDVQMTETARSRGSDVLDRPFAILGPLAVVQPLADGRA